MSEYFRRTIQLLVIAFLSVGFMIVQKDQEPLKVACVGDSITFGYKVANREKNAYPAQLQLLLGKNYDVRNFGVSSRTLTRNGDKPYIKEDAYRDALAFNPDVVLIKLGSNDAKSHNRKNLPDFVKDYRSLIHSFREKNSEVRIVLLTSLPSFHPDSTYIWEPVLRDKIVPMTKKVAKKEGVELIDLHEFFLNKGHLLPDHIHPSAFGASVMAMEIYARAFLDKGVEKER